MEPVKEVKIIDKNWAGIFDDFLNQPPTFSLFRLYILCFVLWNKKVILYLAFHNQSMWDKLHNMYEFVPFFKKDAEWLNWVSMYIYPIGLMVIIYFIVLLRWLPTEGNEKNKESLFYYFVTLHLKSKKREIKETREVLDEKIKTLEKAKTFEKSSEIFDRESEQKKWEFEYEEFKGRPFMQYLYDLSRVVQSSYYDKGAVFILNSSIYVYKITDNDEVRIPRDDLEVMQSGMKLVFIDSVPKNGYQGIQAIRPSLTMKGKFFCEKYEQEEIGRVRNDGDERGIL
jgi:hypothetical protein